MKPMSDQNTICRTCLRVLENGGFTYLDDESGYIQNVGTIREMLQFCVPELDLYVSSKPLICYQCLPILVTVYNFKIKCLNGENLIKAYISRNNLVEYNFVNLKCVLLDEVRIKNQQQQIENRIKQFMLQPSLETIEESQPTTETQAMSMDQEEEEESRLEEEAQETIDSQDETTLDAESDHETLEDEETIERAMKIEIEESDPQSDQASLDVDERSVEETNEHQDEDPVAQKIRKIMDLIRQEENSQLPSLAKKTYKRKQNIVVRKDLFDKNQKKVTANEDAGKNGRIVIKIDRKKLNLHTINPNEVNQTESSPNISCVQQKPITPGPSTFNQADPLITMEDNSEDSAPSTTPTLDATIPDTQNEEKTSYSCKLCNYVTDDVIKMYEHNCSYHSFDYTCQHCPFSTSKVELLGKHVSMVHPKSLAVQRSFKVSENYACYKCPFSARTVDLLRTHQLTAHAKMTQKDEGDENQHSDCDNEYLRQRDDKTTEETESIINESPNLPEHQNDYENFTPIVEGETRSFICETQSSLSIAPTLEDTELSEVHCHTIQDNSITNNTLKTLKEICCPNVTSNQISETYFDETLEDCKDLLDIGDVTIQDHKSTFRDIKPLIKVQIPKGKKSETFCFYCKTSVLGYSRHLTRKHANEKEVKRILSEPVNSLQRKNLIALLRKKGNYSVASSVVKPVRQGHNPTTNYLACEYCMGFYASHYILRHKRVCFKNDGKKFDLKGTGSKTRKPRSVRTKYENWTLVRWTELQKEIVNEYFKTHIENKKVPNKEECEKLIGQFPKEFVNKTWLKLKAYVESAYSKKENLKHRKTCVNKKSESSIHSLNPLLNRQPIEIQRKKPSSDICKTRLIKKKNLERTVVRWTETQKKITKEYFKDHIDNRKAPKRVECEKFMNQHPDELSNKTWVKIKVFIQNEYSRKRIHKTCDNKEPDPLRVSSNVLLLKSQPMEVSSQINTASSDISILHSLRKKSLKRTLVPWTATQKQIAKEFFKSHIENKKPPKRKECNSMIEQYPNEFINKSWLKIKVFIQNEYTKKNVKKK